MLLRAPWPALLAALSLVTQPSVAHLIHPRDVAARDVDVKDWISIGADGTPHTKTAAITTENGAARTISGAPYALTGTVFTITSGTQVTTSTGRPPPPEAKETDGAGGQFAVCHNRVGLNGPFCEPSADSMLSVGRTYYVTWDKTFFGTDTRDDLVNITANYLPSSRRIMNAIPVPAGQGYMPLTIQESFMLGQEVQKPIRLVMTYFDDEEGELKEVPGPRVNIVRADISVAEHVEGKKGGGGVHPAAIAVPVVVGLLAVGLGFWCLWRRNKDRFILSRIRRRSSGGQGYGVGRSRAGRMGGGGGDVGKEEIDLPVSPPPRTAGTNVFREEIRRQDTGR
ncbi:uncharacterized protein DNG_10173 [Cephalotrichum gorgonifer]|uniref:DUF1191 domain-containing protein n=1 Tax=Cephalotrichum gorgonifer TaxID=2041049 RepID=A0AAE8N814_9PEZI|nr:uncharacterized protein DNG_10173 [Cephalotrichum gorgonifer]